MYGLIEVSLITLINRNTMERRTFIRNIGAGAAVSAMYAPYVFSSSKNVDIEIACQQYTLSTYLAREGIDWVADAGKHLTMLGTSGYSGFEPSLESAGNANRLAGELRKAGLWCKSFYVNSALHEPDMAAASITQVLEIAATAKAFGAEIVVTNPVPIRWGGPENKNDAQLATQARALDELGAALRRMGMKLAYHNHDAELREGAREFHHMMVATDPDNVHLCLDPHWIYRGAGNSQIALFDILKLYGPRVVEIHLRQSSGGVWTEAFGEGDIDYRALAGAFNSTGIRPLLVMEQAPEQGTPRTMTTAEALRQSLEYAGRIFRGWN